MVHLLFGAWLLIAVPVVHAVFGLLLIVLLTPHLLFRRRRLQSVLRRAFSGSEVRTTLPTASLLVSGSGMVVTGVTALAGVRLDGLHATSGYVFLIAVGHHLWHRSPLRHGRHNGPMSSASVPRRRQSR